MRIGRVVAALFALLLVGFVAVETAKFVKLSVAPALAPILGTAFALALFFAILYFLWHLLADPTKRLAEHTRDELDYRMERSRTAAELKRRIAAIEEEQRVRALTASARVHERASRAVSEGQMQLELEELKGRSERVVMRSQSAGVARMLARYEAAFFRLQNASDMTSAEKARLLEEMRGLLSEDGSTPTTPTTPMSPDNAPDNAPDNGSIFAAQETDALPRGQSAAPLDLVEYRAPGEQPVSVTVAGLRRLLDRRLLSDHDECRRVGAATWTSVGAILRDEASC